MTIRANREGHKASQEGSQRIATECPVRSYVIQDPYLHLKRTAAQYPKRIPSQYLFRCEYETGDVLVHPGSYGGSRFHLHYPTS